MKLSEYTIRFLGKFITGNLEGMPYRSGPQLVSLFNECGAQDVYPSGGGFPSRHIYVEEKIRAWNGKPLLKQLLATVLDPRAFLEHQLDVSLAVEKLNQHLVHDGYEVVKDGLSFKVRERSKSAVNLSLPDKVSHELTQQSIDENIQKCKDKLDEGDYSGAITNARSLVESVLIGIELEFNSSPPDYDENLYTLYKRVQKSLQLAPERKDISESLRQILTGLSSIVSGLAGMRNKMSDSHATSYRPARHHAQLAVHAAVTLCNFLFETKNYQQARKSGTSVKTDAGKAT